MSVACGAGADLEGGDAARYTPNQAARNLKLGIVAEQKVYYIGVLMTRTENANLDRMIDEMYLETTCACDGLIIIGKCNKEALKKAEQKI